MDKKSYAFGMSLAGNLLQNGVHGLNFNDFVAGLRDMLEGRDLALTMEEAGDALEQFYAEMEAEQQERAAVAGAAAKEEGEKFLAKAARDPEVRATKSGLMYKVIQEGTGRKPKATDQVRCHYEGTFPDGQIFDSSYKRGEPAVFGLNQVIKGWTEGLQLMAEGAKYELYLPYQLAYGEHGAGSAIPPYSALKFVVELLEVL
ncbi:MAG: FKBP-type peptidyl-prolyl cis-trans isomerase [Bacteroidales bacterium]|jgi:FKBP-type peptidyl-prolyl cis-trans isomerase FklB|nr:FKBP-type peptidyl-prolyl cis-trans isomerase [Bacteroidales bacterium]